MAIDKPQDIEVTTEMIRAGEDFLPGEEREEDVIFFLTRIYQAMAFVDQRYGLAATSGMKSTADPKTKQ